ncbi:type III secretion system needle filament subunit SctF [Vibrio parahaemolyticus]|uniref:type III secretion system needle filament subunit SctF n=1 Tax=Vibrio parahaemolyticus TaxID=670 RepID=UPI0004D62F6D|nr:type III secretion system needle filament subunit SctF [Vibrio parahaemolyticus]ALM66560.1 Type III secretion cytoplasmic protein (YscF) [Vibrio parahaemolyticus]AWG78567.1 EscF/YscF/HrpA family type III secretion system needle major subunit [Vibrio parahaemolyticus]AWJ78196.1 EscF/YscF/HrpA family type III secretion system needle major subunit [Vibrio parahaemolyticus]EGQ8295998.1 EscF/YscF/HrpA family type III secretion system needle major subunit [Vibrio parahaemolyticus]EGQ8956547.1 Esc
MSFYDATNNVNLDDVKTKLEQQASEANLSVTNAINNLQNNADDPSKLAELQHAINKWSVVYNINATTTRAIKDVMQSILQKV